MLKHKIKLFVLLIILASFIPFSMSFASVTVHFTFVNDAKTPVSVTHHAHQDRCIHHNMLMVYH